MLSEARPRSTDSDGYRRPGVSDTNHLRTESETEPERRNLVSEV